MRPLPALFTILPLFVVPVSALAAETGAGKTVTEKPVCRYVMHTGTRFKTKACRTSAEWDKLTEQSRRSASELIDRPAISIERGN